MDALRNLQFETLIDAPREQVWDALWDDSSYRKWASVFYDGSYAETDWNEGSRVFFLAPGGDGMASEIARKIPNEFMSFRHLGVVKDGKEQPLDDESKKWTGATENYTLEQANGGTRLLVEMQVTEEFQGYFNETFPKALKKVKELAEERR